MKESHCVLFVFVAADELRDGAISVAYADPSATHRIMKTHALDPSQDPQQDIYILAFPWPNPFFNKPSQTSDPLQSF